LKHKGARRDSATYVRMKKKACTEIGIESFGMDFDATVTQEELIAKIDELNASKLRSTFFRCRSLTSGVIILQRMYPCVLH
jgi:5,10-methylene-tetrahydrofolate dehydrogenase/methenyl tetrahydrofolate cyclohydrolase